MMHNIIWAMALSGALLAGASTPVSAAEVPLPIQEYRVSTDHWSREDFSQAANPSVFTGIYDRALYNTVRQAIVDTGTENSAGGRCAYTRVGVNDYGAVKRLVGRMDGVLRYRHYVPENFINYYEYPDYYAVTAEMPENYQAPLAFIQPVIVEAGQLGTDREKVKYLNDYLCSLMAYDRDTSAAMCDVFAPHSEEVKGACGSHSIAFRFLCSAAGIPCVNVSSRDHTWNLVYADGQWLHVDTAANDNAGWDCILLAETVRSIDRYPEATAFLKELLIPSSTR